LELSWGLFDLVTVLVGGGVACCFSSGEAEDGISIFELDIYYSVNNSQGHFRNNVPRYLDLILIFFPNLLFLLPR